MLDKLTAGAILPLDEHDLWTHDMTSLEHGHMTSLERKLLLS